MIKTVYDWLGMDFALKLSTKPEARRQPCPSAQRSRAQIPAQTFSATFRPEFPRKVPARFSPAPVPAQISAQVSAQAPMFKSSAFCHSRFS
eukprot:6189230-Pleurochrysis_carterae.AAC.2